MPRTEKVTMAVGPMIMIVMGLILLTKSECGEDSASFPTEPHNPTAIVFCPNVEPFRPDKWELREGRLILMVEGSYVITPSGCTLISDLNAPAAEKVASK